MNLTDQQKNLLRLLVSKYHSNGGKECFFTRSQTGTGVSYPGLDSVSVQYDDADLYQLQDENSISLTRVSADLHLGKPTQHGIDVVRDGFGVATDGRAQRIAARFTRTAHRRATFPRTCSR